MAKPRASRSAWASIGAVWVLIAFVGIWDWTVRSGAIAELVLPRPAAVLREGGRLLNSEILWRQWAYTIVEWAAAVGLGVGVGLVLGFVIGASFVARSLLMPALSYLRSIPPIALFPLALVAMGPGGVPVAVVGGLTCLLYIVPGTASGAAEAAARYGELRAILQIDTRRWLRYFIGPGSLYHALAAVRIAATAAFAVVVAGEIVIGGSRGVGAMILDHSERYELESAYFFVVTTGFVGLGIDLGFGRLAERMAQRAS